VVVLGRIDGEAAAHDRDRGRTVRVLVIPVEVADVALGDAQRDGISVVAQMDDRPVRVGGVCGRCVRSGVRLVLIVRLGGVLRTVDGLDGLERLERVEEPVRAGDGARVRLLLLRTRGQREEAEDRCGGECAQAGGPVR
jgi:hypothetical protein